LKAEILADSRIILNKENTQIFFFQQKTKY